VLFNECLLHEELCESEFVLLNSSVGETVFGDVLHEVSSVGVVG